jgi:hypothetical protein
MSKLFFDHLIDLSKVDREIKKIAKTAIEKEELWNLVDEIVHHKVMGCILDKLPRSSHEEFLSLFHSRPHDEAFMFDYLRKKIGDNVEELIKQEIGVLTADLLQDVKSK